MSYRVFWAIPASILYTGRDTDTPAVQWVIRGLELLTEGNPEKAEPLFIEALEIARHGHHSLGKGMAALCLTNLYWGTGRLLQAHELAHQAYKIFQKQSGPDQRHNEAAAAFNLGLVHHLMGDLLEAINDYHQAQQALTSAHQYWVACKEYRRADQCIQLGRWIDHLLQTVLTSAPDERKPTLFLPIHLADGGTATLWGQHGQGVSLIVDGKTLQVSPLYPQKWLVLTADCCVFPLPDEMHPPIQQEFGQDGDYVLAQPGDPLPGDPFYISQDDQGITTFVRDKTIIGTVQTPRILGGAGSEQKYRPVALAVK